MIGLIGAPLSAAAEQGGSSMKDVVIALDHSDSMRDSDPEGERITAAKKLNYYLKLFKRTADARIGVVGFGSTYPTSDWEKEQKLPPRVLLPLKNIGEVDGSVLDFPENQRFPGTDFHAALCLSWTTVVGRPPPTEAECPEGSDEPGTKRQEITDRSRSVVLITDGLPAPRGKDLLKASNDECPDKALKVISTTEDARCYFRGLEEAWRAMTDSVPVDLYIAGIDVRDEWYDFSEEYWHDITGCIGEACEVHVQKVSDPEKLARAIMGDTITVEACTSVNTGQANVRKNICVVPAGISEAAFVLPGFNKKTDAELTIKRPIDRVPSPPSARGIEKLEEVWHVLVDAPPAGEWELWIEATPAQLSTLGQLEVVSMPEPFTLEIKTENPIASYPVSSFVATVNPGNVHLPSVEQYTFKLQRAHGDKSEDSLEVRLDPGQNRPPGEYEFDLQGQALTDKAGRWTFRLTAETPTRNAGATQTVFYGSISRTFRPPIESPELSFEIKKVGDTDWNKAKLEMVISNPGSYPVDVAPGLVASSKNGVVTPKVLGRTTVPPGNRPVSVHAELECTKDPPVQITGTVQVLTVDGVNVPDGENFSPSKIDQSVSCLRSPKLSFEIKKVGDADWNKAKLEVVISNNGSYPVTIVPTLVASSKTGVVTSKALERITVPPGNRPVSVSTELDCTKDGEVQITGTAEVVKINGVDIPPLRDNGNFPDVPMTGSGSKDAVTCLSKPTLEVEIQPGTTPAPNRANFTVIVKNLGSQDVKVQPKLSVSVSDNKSDGEVTPQKLGPITVPGKGSKTIPAELECTKDGEVQITGTVTVLTVGTVNVEGFKDHQEQSLATIPCAPPPNCEQFDAQFLPSEPQIEVYRFGFRLDDQFPFRPRFREQTEQKVQISRDSSEGLCRPAEVHVELLMYPAGSDMPPCESQSGCTTLRFTPDDKPPPDISVDVPDPGTSEASLMRRVTVNGTWSREEQVEVLVPWWAQTEPLWSVLVTVAAILAALGVTSSISTRIIRHEYRDYEEPARICDLAAVRASDGVPMSLVRLGFIPWRAVEVDEQYPRFYLSLAGIVAGPLVVRFANSQPDGRADDPWEIHDEASGSFQKRARQWWGGLARFKTLLIGRRVEGNQFELSEDTWVPLDLEGSLDGD